MGLHPPRPRRPSHRPQTRRNLRRRRHQLQQRRRHHRLPWSEKTNIVTQGTQGRERERERERERWVVRRVSLLSSLTPFFPQWCPRLCISPSLQFTHTLSPIHSRPRRRRSHRRRRLRFPPFPSHPSRPKVRRSRSLSHRRRRPTRPVFYFILF